MSKIWIAVLLAGALVATSCSASTVVSDETTSEGSAEASAVRLIERLGSDDMATDAVIIAMDRGYSGPQVLAAAGNGDLNAGGAIDGQDPVGPPLNLVLYSLDESAAGKPGLLAHGRS